ncbi:MAG: hypothetical protein U0354_15100 [Candidatus Sericytochromatia bacterium]
MSILFDNYSYYIINENEFWQIFKENRKSVFEENIEFSLNKALTDLEKNKLIKLKQNLTNTYKLFIKITCDEKIIGWFYGKQSNEESFEMVNTGLIKEYRNKGIYKSILKEVIKLTEIEGFQKIGSHHHANNNSVIVPKLKQGFIITGMELDDKFGLLIRLTYYFNKTRSDINNFRIGSKKLNKDLEKYLNLWE